MKAARQVTGGLSGGRHRGAEARLRAHAPGGMHAAEADATIRQHPPARHKPRTASTSDPRTHHWELRNGGGRGEEPGGRARCSQSLPPASFEPARKTAEGVRGRAAADRRAHWPRSMRKHSANRSAVADAGAVALGRKALDQGSPLPSSPLVQTKQGRERAPEGPGENVNKRGREGGLGRRRERKEAQSGRGRQTKGATSRDPSAPRPLSGSGIGARG